MGAPVIDERDRRKSWLLEPLAVGGMGNKYDSGRCGTSDGTSGKASKMFWSNDCADPDMGEMERRDPGVSGMIGGSIGDCSGIASSEYARDKLARESYDYKQNFSPGSSRRDFVFVALLRRRSANELALETLRRGERRREP
jgi:hypothetical protein